MVSVNKRIKQIREKNGLSQYQLADKIPTLSQSQIAKIETGQRRVSVADLISISEALNVPAEKLLE